MAGSWVNKVDWLASVGRERFLDILEEVRPLRYAEVGGLFIRKAERICAPRRDGKYSNKLHRDWPVHPLANFKLALALLEKPKSHSLSKMIG